MSTAPTVKGADQMTLKRSRRQKRVNGGQQTSYYYKGPLAAAETFYASAAVNQNYDDVEITRGNGVAEVTITIAEDPGAPGGIVGEDGAVWAVRGQPVQRKLAEHPYFSPSGSIIEELARVEDSIARGLAFSSGDYTWPTHISRYHALRTSGVTAFEDIAIIVTKRFSTSWRSTLNRSYKRVNHVWTLDEIDPPSDVIGRLTELQRIMRDVDHTLPYTDDAFEEGKWEFKYNLPNVTSNDGRRYQIELSWVGVPYWSKVLYPGGSWDPQS